MSAKDLAAMSVEMETSIRKAAKDYGIPSSTLYSHISLQKRSALDFPLTQRESIIAAAVESVRAKRLSILQAAKTYGIPYQTLLEELLYPCTKNCTVRTFAVVSCSR